MVKRSQVAEAGQVLHPLVVQIAVDEACRFQAEALADQAITLVAQGLVVAVDRHEILLRRRRAAQSRAQRRQLLGGVSLFVAMPPLLPTVGQVVGQFASFGRHPQPNHEWPGSKSSKTSTTMRMTRPMNDLDEIGFKNKLSGSSDVAGSA